MKRYFQHEYLKVSHFTAGQWEHPVHNHNHFEIIFVHKGRGAHCVSGTYIPYDGPQLFLLAPCDYHRFEIEEETEFTFIKFSYTYLRSIENIQVTDSWNKNMDQLLIQAQNRTRPLLQTDSEKQKTDSLMRLIAREWQDDKNEGNETVFFLIQAILAIIKRNLVPGFVGSAPKHVEKINRIIQYIHEHIYAVEKTQAAHLADTFGFSKHYFGLFFKEQTGFTLREYISNNKLHLIENRLKYSSFSIKEISDELSFTDLSHFNKFVKQHRGYTPSELRSQLKNP
ncbi:AraC family transcriptional regulator [Dyadobacter sp. LJ53]|uniref:AraC family transcriptional regulator n=1 Tax=Dyadobacter chenwenxiniae TaxID=2906456 RepID=UPI001F3EDFF9|nr:AraC family transcriptional regulator [Dyadobacter chenwenxiniae]MCF0051139.1 AraC family transcriptional regulator [Dyadobacter chenwenxiniae]